MLDDLLGRTELKARIEELEEEVHHLERQLAAEQERRSDAVSARQAAEERVNRLEDRIADLEGRLERARETDGADATFRRRAELRGARLDAVLSRLASFRTDPEGALTAVVDSERDGRGPGNEGGSRDVLADLLGDRVGLVDRAAPCVVYVDDAGLVAAAVRPPVVPEPFAAWDGEFRVDRAWFQQSAQGRHALALVRADLFAAGVYEGGERVSVRGFESDVKGDHSKGGFSQGRFERLREGQIDDHLDRCRAVLDDLDADRLFVVGDRQVVGAFADRATTTATVDATGDPREALDAAERAFWTTRLYGL